MRCKFVGSILETCLGANPKAPTRVRRHGHDRMAGLVILVRLYRQKLFMRKLVQSRLEPEELKKQLDSGEKVFIVDLRHPLELIPDPFTLPGALHLSPDALAARVAEIPRDRDIVLYCTCPSEATAAKTAMTLHKLGIDRVRPLRGGFDEWKRLGYPLDAIAPVMPLVQVEPATN